MTKTKSIIKMEKEKTASSLPEPYTVAEQKQIGRFCAYFGTDVKAVDEQGMTLLHQAARNNWYIEIFKFLVSKGADVNAKDKDGNSVLRWAVRNHRYKNGIESVKFLVSVGADVNVKDELGLTTLHWAISEGANLEFVKILVFAGADVNAKSKEGYTPLDIAKENNKRSIVKYLSDMELKK